MAIRISGMVSGLDTDSIVQELVKAYDTKKEKVVKSQTKLSWKQESWKSLNSEVYSLYNKVGTFRYDSAYNLKSATVSDSTKASVTAGTGAVVGTQSLKIKQLATSGYMTGSKITSQSGAAVTASTKMSELGIKDKATFKVTDAEGNEKKVEINKDMKMSEVVTAFQDAGVNASFDSANGRMFISSSKSGKASDFTIEPDGKAYSLDTATGKYKMSANFDAAAALGLVTSKYIKTIQKQALAEDVKAAAQKYATSLPTTTTLPESDYTSIPFPPSDSNIQEGASVTVNDSGNEWKVSYNGGAYDIVTDNADGTYTTKRYEAGDVYKYTTKTAITYGENDTYSIVTDYIHGENAGDKETTALTYDGGQYTKTETTFSQSAYDSFIEAHTPTDEDLSYDDLSDTPTLDAINELLSRTTAETDENGNVITRAYGFVKDGSINSTNLSTMIEGKDATIELNDAEFTSSSNSFTINGLTINAQEETGDKAITITTSTDAQGIYDKIKDFFSSYNDLINKMTSLYNADSAKDYEPLTDEEKEEMSDDEIEKWEQKIKDSLLRRDSTLSSLMSTMTSAMSGSAYIDDKGVGIVYNVSKAAYYYGDKEVGKTMSEVKGFAASNGNFTSYALSSFGIATLGFLNAKSNEYNAYHIDGDEDDDSTSGKKDKLMAAINENPEAVISFMKNLSSTLYGNIDNMMKSTSMSSAYTVYNDKQMNQEYSDYTTSIKKWETKLEDLEDYYYDKFAHMETMLQKLQDSTSSISSLLGTG